MSIRSQRRCKRCALHVSRTQVVVPTPPGHGQFNLLVVGEAPGAEEDVAGEGFVGRAGKTLDEMLSSAHVSLKLRRGEYGLANIVCCRPPGNRAPSKNEMLTCSPWLEEAITERFNVDVIFAVGKTASQYFYLQPSLWDVLRYAKNQNYVPDLGWVAEQGIKVVPCPHTSPLAFNRNAPNGEKWKKIAYKQAKIALDLLL